MSILGNRVLRTEDGRFLRGAGQYVENLPLEGALTITFVRSPLAHARVERDRHVGRRGPAGRAGADRRGRRPAALRAAALPGPGRRDGPAGDGHGHRPLRRRDRRRGAQRRARGGCGRRRARGRRLRPAARRDRPARGREGRGAPVPGSRHEPRRGRRRAGARRDALRRLRRGRLGHDHEPADGGLPARAALRRGRGRRRRPPHRLALDADPAPGPRRARRRARPRPGGRARGRSGRRRRLRREDGQRRGAPRRLARPPDRAARPLDRDALREHGRAQPRPRPGADLHDRLGPRGEGRRVPARDRGRRGRLPGPRRLPAEPDRPHVERRLRLPGDRDLEPCLRHEHDADRRVPRRGPAGGHAGGRARDGHARRRAAARSRRDPAQELHPEGRVPVHDRLPRDLRLRRLRGRARPRAALGRLRRAARRRRSAAARRAARSSSGSGSAPTSRSRTGSPRRSSARSRSRPTATRSSAPARSRTARATRRPSR